MDPLQIALDSTPLIDAIRITTPHELGMVVAPREVKLEEHNGEMWLAYRFPLEGKTRQPKGALQAFLALAKPTTTPEQVRDFALKWGVLCFCQHKLIASHDLRCFPQCDEPTYTEIREALKENIQKALPRKLRLIEYEGRFREPISLWYQYAGQMRALISIIMKWRGILSGNTTQEWSILRRLEYTTKDGRMFSTVQEMERLNNGYMYQLPPAYQYQTLNNIISGWMREANLTTKLTWVPKGNASHPSPTKKRESDLPSNLNWLFEKDASSPSPDLVLECGLKASYDDVGLFASGYLTLFGVLVRGCLNALSAYPSVKPCACGGCIDHKGNCREFLEFGYTRGRQFLYCEDCRRNIELQKKRDFIRKKRGKSQSS